MRTQGNFNDVFKAVRGYMIEGAEDRPINPVIRRENDVWMLESGLNSFDGDIEIPLDLFEQWWYEGLIDPGYLPDEKAIGEYVAECLTSARDDFEI